MKADLASIPSVDRVLAEPNVCVLCQRCNRAMVTRLVRASVSALREDMRRGAVAGGDREVLLRRVIVDVNARLERALAPRFRRVVNATGIVLHTNLGRAPLPATAVDRIAQLAGVYTNLEIDLDSGRRGSRHSLVEELLCELTGAEAAAVVNNNAAAVFLTLNTLALGKEAVVSRGQLVEIGGSFRIPDIMERSGAVMVEVGTTNRTHLRDFEAVLNDRTGLLLAVHPSNYQVRGFTAEVSLEALASLGHTHGIPVVHDLGGGILIDLRDLGLPYEPLVSDSVSAEADVVTFSGDKILGGPQAGIIVGRQTAVEKIRKNPLMRALRCGKLTYAALEATLRLYLDRESLLRHHPVLQILTVPVRTLRRRGNRLRNQLGELAAQGLRMDLKDSAAQTGSGALPLEEIPSVALALAWPGHSIANLAARLRNHTPSVLGYVRGNQLILDLRSLRADELPVVAEAVRWAVREEEAGGGDQISSKG